MITAKIELPKLAEGLRCDIDAFKVVWWEETVALLQRLGVALDRPYRRIVVDLDFNTAEVTVLLEQLGADAKRPEAIDTTMMYNEEWRTKRPVQKEG